MIVRTSTKVEYCAMAQDFRTFIGKNYTWWQDKR